MTDAERLDVFMARANAAYYATHDPFRDFTTSPEISQVFGEILGLWAAVVWQQMGSPASVLLVELGPGRGTLMRDARRAIAQAMPAFRPAVHLVESSPRLRAVQAGLVPDAVWHDGLDTLPPGPMILLANEFLDALPIRQFVHRGGTWCERWVAAGAFTERPCEPLVHAAPAEGEVREVNEPARRIAAAIGARIASQGGAALFLDYGPARAAPGDSLQALRAARPADPLLVPGAADLTAHVDFEALAAHAAPARVHGPVQQGRFLAALGLFQRSGTLARTMAENRDPARAAAVMQAAQRLAEPDRMGGLFKALALVQPGLPTPPGFE